MVSLAEITILKEVDLAEANIKLRSDGIVLVHYKKNTTLDVALQMKMRGIFDEMTGQKKTKFVFSAAEGFAVTKEARENGPRLQEHSPKLFYALVANNLAYRIVANFYLKVFKPKGNYRIVRNEAEGIAWLNSLH